MTHSRTGAGRRVPPRAPLAEIAEQTELGSVYMRSLIRTQRRTAAIVCVLLAGMLGGTALAGLAAPRLSRVHLLGIPLPWLLLGAVVYPVLIALGWFAVRAAERHERDFAELVRRR